MSNNPETRMVQTDAIFVELDTERKIRHRNKLYYRVNHWPIWIFVFFIAPGPLTFDLFERGFDPVMAALARRRAGRDGDRRHCAGGFRAASRRRTSSGSPKIGRTRSTAASATRPRGARWWRSPCSTSPGSPTPWRPASWRLRSSTTTATSRLPARSGCSARSACCRGCGRARRAKGTSAATSTARCGPSTIAQPVLWLLWKIVPVSRGGDALKLVVFVGILVAVGTSRAPGRAAAHATDRAGRVGHRLSHDQRRSTFSPRRRSSTSGSSGGTTTFTEFLAETLRPRPGNRILDVGCGEGAGRGEHWPPAHFAGPARRRRPRTGKVAEALRETRSHNQRVGVAAGDACRLPFRDGVFDSTYCVAVLQHIGDVSDAVAEIARVTAPGPAGWWSSSPTTPRATCTARRRRGAGAWRPPPGSLRPWPTRASGRRTPPSARRCRACSPPHGIEPSTSACFPCRSVQLACRPTTSGERRRAPVRSRRWPVPPAIACTMLGHGVPRGARRLPARSRRSQHRVRGDPEHDALRHGRTEDGRPSLSVATTSRRDDGRGPRRLGRLRAVLRLGERADAGPARRAVLAQFALNAGGPVLELGCGTGRISIPLARAGVPLVGVDRSAPMLARARQRVKRARLQRRVRLVRGDIRFLPFTDARRRPRRLVEAARRRARRVLHGAGAVRHPAVAAARARPDGDAGGGASRAAAGRHVRARARGRPAVVGGVPEAGQPEGLAGAAAARTSRWSRPCARTRRGADDLRSGVHRAPRQPRRRTRGSR